MNKEHEVGLETEHFMIIDVIKAVCIIMVIITHSDYLSRNIPENSLLFCCLIDMAVPVFMLISGYNYYHTDREEEYKRGLRYNFAYIYSKYKRLFLPYTVIFLLEVLLKEIQGNSISTIKLLFGYLAGGYGPGSYYIPVMFQFYLFAPILSFLISKLNQYELICISIFVVGFEVLMWLIPDLPSIYRILIIRYLVTISLGMYLKKNKNTISSKMLLTSFLIGMLYVLFTNQYKLENGQYTFSLVRYWQSTAWPTAFYVFPIFSLALSKCRNLSGIVRFKLMGKLGQATWHIFLIQMFYYETIYKGCEFKNILQKYPYILEFCINILINCTIGIAFFQIHSIFTKKVALYKIRKKNASKF